MNWLFNNNNNNTSNREKDDSKNSSESNYKSLTTFSNNNKSNVSKMNNVNKFDHVEDENEKKILINFDQNFNKCIINNNMDQTMNFTLELDNSSIFDYILCYKWPPIIHTESSSFIIHDSVNIKIIYDFWKQYETVFAIKNISVSNIGIIIKIEKNTNSSANSVKKLILSENGSDESNEDNTNNEHLKKKDPRKREVHENTSFENKNSNNIAHNRSNIKPFSNSNRNNKREYDSDGDEDSYDDRRRPNPNKTKLSRPSSVNTPKKRFRRSEDDIDREYQSIKIPEPSNKVEGLLRNAASTFELKPNNEEKLPNNFFSKPLQFF